MGVLHRFSAKRQGERSDVRSCRSSRLRRTRRPRKFICQSQVIPCNALRLVFTDHDAMERAQENGIRRVQIGDDLYYLGADVAKLVGISRQTLWRWRSAGHVPAGVRYRNGQILFTEADVALIRRHANHLEPAVLLRLAKVTPPARGPKETKSSW